MVHQAKVLFVFACIAAAMLAQDAAPAHSSDLVAPVRLMTGDGAIDLGKLSKYAHAGPWIADLDGDGKRDLVVGDFPGNFWFFQNTGTEKKPAYKPGRKLKAGEADAKVPVY
jgi:hypothetical protein